MKIIFICGSIEPGKDGVGDYIRRLAGSLIKKEHSVSVLAINDFFVSYEEITNQLSEGIKIPVLRLPGLLEKVKRFVRVKEWIDKNNPEWISLQFVPFAFNAKGLPYGWATELSKLAKNVKWHIMFHELWVGMTSNASIKDYLWGKLQKKLIKKFLFKLQPLVVHTQTKLYLEYLKELGCNPLYLPLFGNIYVVQNEIPNNLKSIRDSDNELSFILFGGIHAGAPVKKFVQQVLDQVKLINATAKLTIIGRCGSEQQVWENDWTAAGLKLVVLGEQSSERISYELSHSKYGIATTPISLMDKSGSVAAMLEHGLIVINVSRDWNPSINFKYQLDEGMIQFKPDDSKSIFEMKLSPPTSHNLAAVSDQFIYNLSSK